jgi:phenylacetate-coenzyme A ligase PaaK-like adenylate-forming protein
MKRKLITAGCAAAVGTALGIWMLHRPIALAWDMWQAGTGSPAKIAARQRRRLADLVAFARLHSPYYRDLYKQLPAHISDPRVLPVVMKPQLMAHFDRWVTDPSVTRAGVESFVMDPLTIGQRYLGRYTVWTTSGTTGRQGIFVVDPEALQLGYILGVVRSIPLMRLITPKQLRSFLRRGSRNALLVVTGGHFVGASETERLKRRSSRLANAGRTFSVLQPLPELVAQLNAFQPNRLGGYPTAMALLADEQAAGRLHIHPNLLTPSGESLTLALRHRLQQAFDCPVRTVYSASEFMGIAFECAHGWLHVNADWVMLEPVDAMYQPIPAGQPSHTVLLTHLANHVQPLIRYDLGDSVTVKPDPCPCGSPLPAIQVQGRTADILRLPSLSGGIVAILPLAIGTVVEETPGVYRAQVMQTGPQTLLVRLEVHSGADRAQVWEDLSRRLQAFLTSQGVTVVTITLDDELPQQEPIGGKFRQVMSAI